jgi:hypothetical protein
LPAALPAGDWLAETYSIPDNRATKIAILLIYAPILLVTSYLDWRTGYLAKKNE